MRVLVTGDVFLPSPQAPEKSVSPPRPVCWCVRVCVRVPLRLKHTHRHKYAHAGTVRLQLTIIFRD